MRALFAALPNTFANDFDGKKLAWIGMVLVPITANCFWKLDEFFRCFGLDLSVGDSLDFDQEFLDSLVGLTGTVRVKDQLFNGQKVSKVVAYLPAEDSQLVEDTE